MGIASCCEQKTDKQQKKQFPNPPSKRASRQSSGSTPYFKQPHNNTTDSLLTPDSRRKNKAPTIKKPSSPPKSLLNLPKKEQTKKKRGPEDFQHIRYLGKGAFGCVVLVQQKTTGKRFAMKIIEKNKIKQFNLLQSDRIKKIGHQEFFVMIKQTFQNKNNIYIIMEYLPMGDLYFYLRKKESSFTEEVIAKIVSEIVVSIGLLHQKGIIYRELKPQNLLVTDQGHIKLTDYGLSKVIIQNRKSISTFVGTLQYMAPQAYSGDFGQKADIWSIGILMYQLFFKQNLYQLDDSSITNILKEEAFPIQRQQIENKINSRIGFMSLKFRDLLLKILEKDPERRFELEQIKAHQFFKDIDWEEVQKRENEPPLKQLVQKKSMIKFRDPTVQKYYRKQYVKQRTIKENYEMELYEFRNSQ